MRVRHSVIQQRNGSGDTTVCQVYWRAMRSARFKRTDEDRDVTCLECFRRLD